MTTRATLALALLLLGIGAISPAANAQISSCPFAIFGAGNYTVTANLTATTGDCITIAASNVTIDLQGHTITGPGSGIYNGITDTGGPLQNVIIANGTIKGFNEGIFLGITGHTTISKVNVVQNVTGMELDQDHNAVTDSQANNNEEGIVLVRAFNTVANSQANNNSGFGVAFEGGDSTFTNSQANNNRSAGIAFAADVNTVTNSQANNNPGDGIQFLGEDCALINSQANNNGGNGIFSLSANNTIINSPANGNKGNGMIFGGFGELLTGDRANGNGGVGIALVCPSNLFGNTAHGNTSGNTSPVGLPGCTLLDNNF